MADKKSAHAHYERFSLPQRVEHIVLVLSFTLLGLTGLIQKYALSGVAAWLIGALGGIESVRIIHRVAAIVFALQSVYHIMVLAYKVFVARTEMTMLPGLKDAIDAIDVVRYNLGLTKEHPKMPRYNFAEKVEYWAMIWGGVVMGITGFMLWNPIATSRLLPGQFIPAAKAAHGGEAVLAVLAILIWHFYSVHIKTFNKSMFTGKMTQQQMEAEHADELQRIMAGTAKRAVDPAGVRRRQRVFVPIAASLGLLMGLGVIWFATFEETAVAVVPPPATEQPVFVPLTPTPAPVATIDNTQLGKAIPHPVAGQEQCDTCHGPNGASPAPANHTGRPVESCQLCHAPGAAASAGGSGPSAIPANHDLTSDAYKDCALCHGAGKLKPFPANHTSFANDGCTMCHQPAASGEAPAAGGAAAIPHPIEGDAYKDCTTCHGAGQMKPFPANHASFANDGCTMCHQPAGGGEAPAAAGGATAIPHPIEGEAYRDCTTCHGVGKMKPYPENHASFANDGCTACHQPAGAAPAEPSASTQPAAGPQGVPHSVELEAFADCTKCHGGADTPHPYPENHASFTVASCTGCHPAPADEAAITVNAPNPTLHSVTEPIYVNCATCHAPDVELGIRAPASHAKYEFTAESCAACHAASVTE